MKIKVTLPDTVQKGLETEIAAINRIIREKADQAAGIVAQQTMQKAKDLAASRLHSTRSQYTSALSFQKVANNVYSITLDASAVHLEEGYSSFDMKPGLLKLGQAISNTGKGIKVSKAGYRYRAIPFDQKTAAANPEHPKHNSVVQAGKPNQTTAGNLAQDLKNLIKGTGLKGVSKDNRGQPIIGRVATVTTSPYNRFDAQIKDHEGSIHRVKMDKEMDPRLGGLTKYQYEVKNRNGGKTVKSAYMTFRIVSENPKQAGKWIHPGFGGAKIFPDLERWAQDTFAKMMEEIFKAA